MRWRDMQPSDNVEDRRGMSPGGGFRMGGLGGMGMGTRGMGLGGLVLLLVLGYCMTGDPLGLLDTGNVDVQQGPAETGARGTPKDAAGEMISRVFGDIEATWTQIFNQANRSYRKPTLVLFSDATQSACGLGSAAVGPFYCPGDQKVYLDLSFFNELARRFGAPGDFAQAYVVAHEVGHHVQNLLGIFDRVRGSQTRANANALSVRQELQADCFAGIWGHYAATRGLLETGDVEEGLAAAGAIGDDRLQRSTQGYVRPESFTHGSSEDRVHWFREGLQSGELRSCDTFGAGG
jgi:uncharacterized protein